MTDTPTDTSAAPASRGNNGLVTGLVIALVVIVLAFAAFVFAPLLLGGNTQKIGPGQRLVQAPADTIVEKEKGSSAAVLPPQKGTVKITPQGGIEVDATNPDRSGINQNVTVTLPNGCTTCAPRVVVPAPCQSCARPPVVRYAPRNFRPAPMVRIAPPAPRATSCFVQVDVQGPPSEIQIKDGSGRMVGHANVVGSGRIAVPCDFARAGSGQICLITGGPNAPARNLSPEWFAMAQSNLSRGTNLLNAGHPVWFRKN